MKKEWLTYSKSKFTLLILLFLSLSVFAQQEEKNEEKKPEKERFTEEQKQKINKMIDDSRKLNAESAEDNRISYEQSHLINDIRKHLGEAKVIMSQGLDSAKIRTEYDEVINWHLIASAGLADSLRHQLTLGNLSVSKVIYHEILVRSRKRVDVLTNYRSELERTLFNVDSLINRDELYIVPKEEAAQTAFYANTYLLITEAKQIQEKCRKNVMDLNELIAVLGIVIYDSEGKLNTIEKLQSELWNFDRKGSSLGVQNLNDDINVKVSKSFMFSIKKMSLALKIFYKNHKGIVYLFLIIFVSLFVFLKMLSRNYRQVFEGQEEKETFIFLRRPFGTALFISLILIQFFYLKFPFVIYSLCWLLCIVSLFYIVYPTLKPASKKWFGLLTAIVLLTYIDNLLLIIYEWEIFIILLLSLGIIALTIYGFLNVKGFGGFSLKVIKGNMILAFVFQLITFYGFISHNYNLSKRMMVAGVFVLIIFIGVIYLVRYLYQIFHISMEVYKRSDEEEFKADINKLANELPLSARILANLLALFLFLNTFYFFQERLQPWVDSFTMTRKLGNLEFSFSSISLFFLIIYISVLISKIVSFLLEDSYIIRKKLQNSKHKSISNSLLLFRIGIITLGVLIAFASSGIPIDRLAIVISALGVGIGFGLQTLVNNLVSGIIIAFEKPINVGDVIDVAGKMGTMKSIGIRSSKMTTWDGSDVVIPNGDLLNQHLVNWTLGDSRARFVVEVGVAYGTDLEEVNQAIKDLLKSYNSILKYPEPAILFNQFGSSSIDIAIKFWVGNFADGFAIKSDFLIAIDKMFKEKGFEIPFPQQDVYIKQIAPPEDKK